MTQQSQETAVEQRFAHLLQPIRDLTRNWNIDITSELENYLQEIESVTVTFDGGRTKLNFAEAALLIQATTCIYSKKVEYLYTLVYQVLDLVANKKKLKQAADADGHDKDASDLVKQNDDDEVLHLVCRRLHQDVETVAFSLHLEARRFPYLNSTQFLSLDDIKDAKTIDFKHDTDEQAVPTLPTMSLCLIPLTEAEKGENPLLSTKGDVLGSRNDFKINVCEVHPSGSLLLDLSHLNLLDLSIQDKPSSTPFVPRTVSHTDVPPPDGKLDFVSDEGAAADVSMDDHPEPFDSPAGDRQIEEQPVATSPIIEPDDGNPELEPFEHRDRQTCKRLERNKNLIELVQEKTDSDPWIIQDPHQQCSGEKPFTRRKTFRVPPSLISETNKKRKRKSTAHTKKQPLISLTEFCVKAFYSRAAQFPRNPIKVPIHAEFEDLFWTEYKRRQSRLRKEFKMLKHQNRLKDLSKELLTEDRDELLPEEFGGSCEDDLDNDEPAQIPFDVQNPPAQDFISDDAEMPHDIRELDDVHVVSSYEELLRHHIEAYIVSAQKFVQMTDLSKRVAEWEDKILPVLEEEERHGPFDIHKSGTEVIKHLEKHATKKQENELELPSEKVPFKRISKNKPVHETCRLFLATLQLANTYNVEISVEGTLEEAVDTMSIRLLSTKRQFEELENYRVPSFDG